MLVDFESLGLRYGEDYAAVWDSTMVRFWFPGGAEVEAKVSAWLAERNEGQILDDAALKDNACLFPDRRYGKLWYLLNTGHDLRPFLHESTERARHAWI